MALILPSRYRLIPLRTATLPPASHTNALLLGRRGALIVDPGSAYPRELARLRGEVHRLLGRGGTLAAVLLTHHHGDHVAGAATLARELSLPVWAHPETFARVPALAGLPRLDLGEGQTLTVDGGHPLQVLHTPGHAPGHLCLWDADGRTLVVGDMAAAHSTTVIDPPEGQMAVYLASLERLVALEPRWLIPGHGEPMADGAATLKRLLTHRRWREWRVLVSLGPEPMDLLALTREAYNDVPSITWPLASRSALAHLLKLEADGRVARSAEGGWYRPDQSRSSSG